MIDFWFAIGVGGQQAEWNGPGRRPGSAYCSGRLGRSVVPDRLVILCLCRASFEEPILTNADSAFDLGDFDDGEAHLKQHLVE